jgi:uncharacterized protein (TIRG00374 family)
LARRVNESSKRILLGVIAVITISLIALLIIAKGFRNLIIELRMLNPYNFLLAILLIYLGEVVRALRLQLIMKSFNKTLSFRYSLLARLLGRFAATVTPGGSGGSPARASIIGTYSGTEIGEALGVSLIETFADTLWPATFVLFVSIIGVRSIIMLIVSIAIAGLWIAGTLVVSSFKLMVKIYKRLKLTKSLLCRIERQRTLFVEALKRVKNLRLLALITFLTIIAHLLEAYGILVLGNVWDPMTDSMLFIRVLAAVESSYLLISIPTPGGSGGIEYGLYLYLGSSLAIKWRTTQLIASLLPGVLLSIFTPKVLNYIRESSFPETAECENLW